MASIYFSNPNPIYNLDRNGKPHFVAPIFVDSEKKTMKIDPDTGITINGVPIGGSGGTIDPITGITLTDPSGTKELKMNVNDEYSVIAKPSGEVNKLGVSGITLNATSTLTIGTESLGQADILTLKTTIPAQIADLENGVDDLDTRVTALEAGSGTSLEPRVAALEAGLQSAEGDIGDLQTDVGTLNTTVGTLETTVGTLDTAVGILNTKVGNLENGLQAAESDITDMQVFVKSTGIDLGTTGTIKFHPQGPTTVDDVTFDRSAARAAVRLAASTTTAAPTATTRRLGWNTSTSSYELLPMQTRIYQRTAVESDFPIVSVDDTTIIIREQNKCKQYSIDSGDILALDVTLKYETWYAINLNTTANSVVNVRLGACLPRHSTAQVTSFTSGPSQVFAERTIIPENTTIFKLNGTRKLESDIFSGTILFEKVIQDVTTGIAITPVDL